MCCFFGLGKLWSAYLVLLALLQDIADEEV